MIKVFREPDRADANFNKQEEKKTQEEQDWRNEPSWDSQNKTIVVREEDQSSEDNNLIFLNLQRIQDSQGWIVVYGGTMVCLVNLLILKTI